MRNDAETPTSKTCPKTENLVKHIRMSARGGGVSIRSKKTKSQLACRSRPTHSAAGSHQVAHKFRERANPGVARPRSYIIR